MHVILGHLSDTEAAEPERLDVWRSDTLTSLTTLPENEPRLERAARGICIELTDILSPWLFEAGPFSKVEARFRDDILGPAIKLHQDLKSASHQYETRYIKVLDRLSPKQMLDEWELKDADTWQKVRAERDVGRALYCLHPSIIRLRAESTTPIVVAKPVIVVQGPNKKISSDSRGRKDSSLNDMKVLPAATEPSVPHLNITSGTPPRRLSVPVDPSAHIRQKDRSSAHHHHRKPHIVEGGKRQPVPGRPPQVDPQNVISPHTRGHNTEGSSYSHQSSHVAAVRRQPSRKSSRDASGQSVEVIAQPPSIIAPGVPGQSSSAGNNSRGLKRLFGRQ